MELEKVLFVIVLYQQALKSSNAFKSLLPLIADRDKQISIFVYDNSPVACEDISGCCRYVHDPVNPGVSRAYNEAFLYAKSNRLKFLLLMDQDSQFPEKTLLSYRDAVEKYDSLHVFASIARNGQKFYSPFRLQRGRGTPLRTAKPGVHSLKEMIVINSGLMVSLEAFEKAGGFDERFPLDFSDIDFCERLANQNFQLCLMDASIVHDHSSAINSDPRRRFGIFLKSLRLFKKISRQRISYWFAGFPRAVKLSAIFRDRWFLQEFFKLRA